MYSPLGGIIVIGEEEVEGGEPYIIYKRVQKPLWNDTVRQILDTVKKATVEEVIEASKSYADEFISDLSRDINYY